MKIAKMLFCMLCILMPMCGFGVEKKYPPYPEVWGYDLSNFQAVRDNDTTIDAYHGEDGDILFKFRSVAKRKIPGDKNSDLIESKYSLLSFFTGEIKELSEEDREELRNLKTVKDAEKIIFLDGSLIEHYHHSGAHLCYYDDIRSDYLIKKNSQGKEIGKYSIIAATPKIDKIKDLSEPGCETGFTEYLYKQLYSLSSKFIKLEDGTFITYSSDSNLIVRFNKDLKTKFISKNIDYTTNINKNLKKNLFVLPYSLIEEIITNIDREKNTSDMQALHDELLRYLVKDIN